MADVERKRFKKVKDLEAENNPCYKEQQMSLDCLTRNSQNSDKCFVEFENYKQCRAFWNDIRIERMRRGISPLIPPEQEREQILKERFQGKKKL